MVQKALGIVGVVLVLIGLITTIVISVIKEWVNVNMVKIDACEDSPIGKLGLYGAVFDPECVTSHECKETDPVLQATCEATVSSYGNFAKEESGTTEFWPLFPSQTGFGPTFEDANIPEFTTCEEFWGEGANSGINAFSENVVKPQVQGSFLTFEEGLTNNTAKFVGTIEGLVTALNAFIDQAWNAAGLSVVKPVVAALQPNFASVPAGTAGLFNLLQTASSVTFTIFTTAKINEPIAAVNASGAVPFADLKFALESLDLLQTGVALEETTTFFALAQSLDPVKVATLAGGLNIPELAGLADPDAVEKLQGGLALAVNFNPTGCNVGFPGADLSAFTSCVFTGLLDLNVTLDEEVVDYNFAALRAALPSILPILGAAQQQSLSVAKAYYLDPCGDKVSVEACNSLYTAAPESLTDAFPLCGLNRAQNPNNTASLDCSILDLMGDAAASGDLDAVVGDLAALVPVLLQVFGGCAQKGYPFTACWNGLLGRNPAGVPLYNTTTIPDSKDAPWDSLCFATKAEVASSTGSGDIFAANCSTFEEFLPLAAQANPAAAAFQAAYGACLAAAGGDTTRAQCVGILTAAATQSNVASFIDGETAAERIAACKDDEKDAAAISTAQVLIPIAIAVETIALLWALASISANKGLFAIIAGVMAIIGCVCSLVGLLLVINAPVYAAVGEACKPYETCYVSGVARPIAFVAIAGPLFAGISLIVASCFNKGTDEDQITSKVDNTY